jgi:hypothetical protein
MGLREIGPGDGLDGSGPEHLQFSGRSENGNKPLVSIKWGRLLG